MLILILIDVQHSQIAVFSFEKGLNHQKYSSSGFLHLVKNPPVKFHPPPLTAIWKTLMNDIKKPDKNSIFLLQCKNANKINVHKCKNQK